jgi:hypothetical protein
MNDYLDQNNLHSLYNRFPTIENFEGKSLKNKLITMIRIESFSFGTKKQYAPIETSHLTQQNIEALKGNTFTVTGHQLNLFTGLYISYIKSSPLLILRRS